MTPSKPNPAWVDKLSYILATAITASLFLIFIVVLLAVAFAVPIAFFLWIRSAS